MGLGFRVLGLGFRDVRTIVLPLVSREWKNGSNSCNSSYNCTPFFHSPLTKGKLSGVEGLGFKGFREWVSGFFRAWGLEFRVNCGSRAQGFERFRV